MFDDVLIDKEGNVTAMMHSGRGLSRHGEKDVAVPCQLSFAASRRKTIIWYLVLNTTKEP